jgi:multicomponent Na+:H+ antiporter subunit B
METLITFTLLTMLAVVTLGVVRLRNLFSVIVLFAIYSFVMASVLVVLDAPDVAMTEAAVGAGVSTVLLLAALATTRTEESPPKHSPILPLIVSGLTAAALIYGTLDLPPFGAPDAPAHAHVAKYYLDHSVEDTGVPNVVTSVLASYRGFDTLGEVVVIFAGGMAVLLIFRKRRGEATDSEKGKGGKA